MFALRLSLLSTAALLGACNDDGTGPSSVAVPLSQAMSIVAAPDQLPVGEATIIHIANPPVGQDAVWASERPDVVEVTARSVATPFAGVTHYSAMLRGLATGGTYVSAVIGGTTLRVWVYVPEPPSGPDKRGRR